MTGVARKDGTDTINTGHGCDSTTVTDVGSDNVFINSKGACRINDTIRVHNVPSGNNCVPHTAEITSGSSKVFVNSKAIARDGDSADSGNISSGSNNVFAG
jgi:uncharacterized Zn-binding protein involved in type VI secretion